MSKTHSSQTPEARAQVSRRMKKYWKKRRENGGLVPVVNGHETRPKDDNLLGLARIGFHLEVARIENELEKLKEFGRQQKWT